MSKTQKALSGVGNGAWQPGLHIATLSGGGQGIHDFMAIGITLGFFAAALLCVRGCRLL